MLVLLSASMSIYKCIKSSMPFTQYTAHDLSMLDTLAINKALPFPFSLSEDKSIMLVPPPNYTNIFFSNTFSSMLGMLYITLHNSTIVYVDSIDANTAPSTNTLYFVLSLAPALASYKSIEDKDSKLNRPIFFDVLFTLPNEIEELSRYTNEDLHNLMLTASRYWESHHLYTILFSTSLLDRVQNNGDIESFLQLCTLIKKIPQRSILPLTMQNWIIKAKQLWMLSSTNCNKLQTLVEGYCQQGHEVLPKALTSLLENPIRNPTDRARNFSQATKYFLQLLH